MSIDFSHLDAWAVKFAGVLGAAVSMRFIQGTFTQRFLSAVSGAIVSYYVSPHLATKISTPEGLTGFVVGLFGMAIASRVWEFVQETPIGALWAAATDRIRGGKPDA